MSRALYISVILLIFPKIILSASVPGLVSTKVSHKEGLSGVARNVIINVRAFAEVVEKHLPNEVKQENNTLVLGVRHFALGLKQIAASLDKLFFDENQPESRQLSEATIQTAQVVSAFSERLHILRQLISQAISSYNFYVPEIWASKCFVEYMSVEYPEKALYEYPMQMMLDLYEYASVPKQNAEVLQDDIVVPNDSENEIEKDARSFRENNNSVFNFDEVVEHSMGLPTKNEVQISRRRTNWRKCVQMYVLEAFVRLVLGYFGNA